MTWDGVPWAVGGGAVMPVEAMRLIPYLIAGSREGVAGAGDAAVLQLGTPGGQVRVMPGAVAALNRGADPVTGGGQAYLARNPTEDAVAIAPTAAGVTRYDLIAVVIKDPQYAGQPAPASVQNGPYVSTVVYQNVAASTRSLQQVAPGQTGLALALVTMPPATTTVSQSQITDLRQLVNPRVQQVTKILDVTGSPVNLTSATLVAFPSAASWSVDIPSWAQSAHFEGHVANLRVSNDATAAGDWGGGARMALGSIVTSQVSIRPPIPGASSTDNFGYVAGGEVAVPADHRGTTKTLQLQALRSTSSSGVTVAQDAGSLVLAKVTFYEAANADVWTSG